MSHTNVITILCLIGLISAQVAPNLPASKKYADSLAAAAPRATLYFSFVDTGVDMTTTGATLSPMGNVIYADGIQVHDKINGPSNNAADRALRLTGEDKSCMKSTSFSSSMDVCLKSPAQCSLTDAENNNAKGISVSMWVNLPQEITQTPRYLLDTGGDENGNAGVAVWFTGSTDGHYFSHQITILVSTGASYWKVILNGMIRAHQWNNLGFTFSPDDLADGGPMGLRAHINGSTFSTAWKRHATVAGDTNANHAQTDVQMSVGCKLDGTQATLGYIDDLAIWYQPFTTDDAAWFPGEYEFTTVVADVLLSENEGANPEPNFDEGYDFQPWQYVEQLKIIAAKAQDETAYMDETWTATEGDCLVGDISTWGKGGNDGKPHPVDCADTRMELEAALTLNNQYSGYELAKAMIRVVNRAGDSGLSYNDMNYIMDVAMVKCFLMLRAEGNFVGSSNDAQVYTNLIAVISKLQEKMYGDDWDTIITSEKKAGIMGYLSGREDTLVGSVEADMVVTFDEFYKELGNKIMLTGTVSTVAITANSNESTVTLVRTTQPKVTSDFIYPDYALTVKRSNQTEPYYNFAITRKESWGIVRDYVVVPKDGIVAAYDTTTDLTFTGKIYNSLFKHSEAPIHTDVTGVSGYDFFVNSRVISITLAQVAATAGTFDDEANMVKINLAHKTKQKDAPYRKGAVLCVWWNVDSTIAYGGSWDTLGCRLYSTNDTHSTCACNHMTDFALLMEDHTPDGRMPDALYYVCYAIYGVSLALLAYFMFLVVGCDRLHYELHIVQFNCALALFLAIIFYLLTIPAVEERLACVAVSVFLHYSYTAAYLWIAISAHYIFRACTKGHLGGRVLTYYSYIGWGLPAIFVVIMCCIDISRYGIGDRCLGAHNDYFLWVYVGMFLALTFVIAPLILISFMNIGNAAIKDPIDQADIRWGLIGITLLWPFIMVVWVMAVFIYLVPIDVQFIDWLFELFNSLQGVMFFMMMAVLSPSMRIAIRTCGRAEGRARAPPVDTIYDDDSNAGDTAPVPQTTSTTADDGPERPPSKDVDELMKDMKKTKSKTKTTNPEWNKH